ncbi:MAG TPA: SPW repeat protein [Actinomycetota bacterium]|nr:SPW repeat protein [Actinomycetota bacterium]
MGDTASNEGPRTEIVWAAVMNLLSGAWLVGAPHALGYSDVADALWNDMTIGLVVIAVAVIRLITPARSRWLSLVNLLLALWLLAAPTVFEHEAGSPELWNDIVLGLIILTESSISLVYGRRAAAASPSERAAKR